jgi:hypothetical protein
MSERGCGEIRSRAVSVKGLDFEKKAGPISSLFCLKSGSVLKVSPVLFEMSYELHNAGRDLFKVDITQVAVENSPNYLALLNFNIPADRPDFDGCLQNIVGFLDRHFHQPQPRFTYQVTASYHLRKPDTGEERVWTGSFLAGSEQNCSLSGPLFLVYQRDSFLRVVRQSVTPENVEDCLSWKEADTEWQFSHLSSVIVCFQARLNVSHPFFHRFGIFPAAPGRADRRHHTVVDPS